MLNIKQQIQTNSSHWKLFKFGIVPVSIITIWYAYIFIHTRAMFYLAPIGMNIENEFLKYSSYLLPALVTSLILSLVFAPLLIFIFGKRAIAISVIVTLPTCVYYLYIKAWPLEWFYFNIESFLLMIVFYMAIKLLLIYRLHYLSSK